MDGQCELESQLMRLDETNDDDAYYIAARLEDFFENGPSNSMQVFRWDDDDQNNPAQVFEIKEARFRIFGFQHPNDQNGFILTHLWKKRKSYPEQSKEFEKARSIRDKYLPLLKRK